MAAFDPNLPLAKTRGSPLLSVHPIGGIGVTESKWKLPRVWRL